MIEKAKAKINAEVQEISSPMAQTLGTYINNVILTSEINAAAVLKEGKSLKDFIEKLWKSARNIHGGKYKELTAEKATSAIFKEFADDTASVDQYASPEVVSMINAVCTEKSTNSICLTSDVVIPMLYAYYGIPLTGTVNNKQPRTSVFKRVSLD